MDQLMLLSWGWGCVMDQLMLLVSWWGGVSPSSHPPSPDGSNIRETYGLTWLPSDSDSHLQTCVRLLSGKKCRSRWPYVKKCFATGAPVIACGSCCACVGTCCIVGHSLWCLDSNWDAHTACWIWRKGRTT